MGEEWWENSEAPVGQNKVHERVKRREEPRGERQARVDREAHTGSPCCCFSHKMTQKWRLGGWGGSAKLPKSKLFNPDHVLLVETAGNFLNSLQKISIKQMLESCFYASERAEAIKYYYKLHFVFRLHKCAENETNCKTRKLQSVFNMRWRMNSEFSVKLCLKHVLWKSCVILIHLSLLMTMKGKYVMYVLAVLAK